jgi:hypothetical protein
MPSELPRGGEHEGEVVVVVVECAGMTPKSRQSFKPPYTVPADELGTALPGDKKFAMGHRPVTAFPLFVACILRSSIGLADIGKSCTRTGGVKGGPATGKPCIVNLC